MSCRLFLLTAEIVLALSMVLVGQEQGEAAKERAGLITGSRTWKLADGEGHRMRLLRMEGNGAARFLVNRKQVVLPLQRLGAEERELLRSLRDGNLALVKTPGLNVEPDFTAGKRGLAMKWRSFWVGEQRIWTHRNGKRVEAALINLMKK